MQLSTNRVAYYTKVMVVPSTWAGEYLDGWRTVVGRPADVGRRMVVGCARVVIVSDFQKKSIFFDRIPSNLPQWFYAARISYIHFFFAEITRFGGISLTINYVWPEFTRSVSPYFLNLIKNLISPGAILIARKWLLRRSRAEIISSRSAQKSFLCDYYRSPRKHKTFWGL